MKPILSLLAALSFFTWVERMVKGKLVNAHEAFGFDPQKSLQDGGQSSPDLRALMMLH
jgi:hypothetical protein